MTDHEEAIWTAASLIDEACMGGVCPNRNCDSAGIDPSNWCWWCMARGWLKTYAPKNYPGPMVGVCPTCGGQGAFGERCERCGSEYAFDD